MIRKREVKVAEKEREGEEMKGRRKRFGLEEEEVDDHDHTLKLSHFLKIKVQLTKSSLSKPTGFLDCLWEWDPLNLLRPPICHLPNFTYTPHVNWI